MITVVWQDTTRVCFQCCVAGPGEGLIRRGFDSCAQGAGMRLSVLHGRIRRGYVSVLWQDTRRVDSCAA